MAKNFALNLASLAASQPRVFARTLRALRIYRCPRCGVRASRLLNTLMRKLIFILLLWAAPVRAEWSSWDSDTRALFVASTVAIAADWATTRYGVTHGFPNNTYETNPILGRYPSRDRVDLYMIGILISNYYITDWLPPQYRNFYLGWRTIEHGTAAHGNVQLGWKMQF